MTVAVYLTAPKPTYEYLRIHVRANSNGEKDQEVKMEIKDIVVNYLTPYIADCESKNEAIVLLNDKKDDIEPNRMIEISKRVLSDENIRDKADSLGLSELLLIDEAYLRGRTPKKPYAEAFQAVAGARLCTRNAPHPRT